jgi:ubiquinone/menaquinone biosynthesis C-methylase UbiE
MARYIIHGGLEGKERLAVLGRVLRASTLSWLERAGLAPGMSAIDLGCGGGDVTLELARRVDAQGRVIGVDMDETNLALARRDAEAAGLGNVHFQVLRAEAWGEVLQYDLLYCRFLLSHLADPADMLRRMLAAARPGGVAVVEDVDFRGHFCYPPCAGFDRYVELYRAAAARQGADADIGPKLYQMLLDAGWRNVELNVLQPAFADGEGKQLALLTLINIADAVLDEELATASELQTAIDELTAFTADPRTVIGLPRVFQLCARASAQAK